MTLEVAPVPPATRLDTYPPDTSGGSHPSKSSGHPRPVGEPGESPPGESPPGESPTGGDTQNATAHAVPIAEPG